MEKMREEFEAWAKLNGLRLERQTSMCGGDMGRYDFGPTQAALDVWRDAWQASRASLCVKLPENCKGMALTVDEFRAQLDTAGVGHE